MPYRSPMIKLSPAMAVLTSIAAGLLSVSAAALGADPEPSRLDYNFHIRPILSDRCFICHGPDEKKRKANLRLDVRQGALDHGAIVPGKPDESLLMQRIT